MDAKQHLEQFFEINKKENVTFAELKKFGTITQQHLCQFPNKISVEGSLMGLYSIINRAHKITITEKPGTNPLLKDFEIIFHIPKLLGDSIHMECSMLKEKGVRKPSSEGTWGINFSSFKQI